MARVRNGAPEGEPGLAPVATERKPVRLSLPCVYVGDPAPPPPGKSVVRRYYTCDAGLGVVCPCRCGPKCTAYIADAGD